MNRRLVVFTLALFAFGCERTPPERAADATLPRAAIPLAAQGLTNKIWVRSDAQDLPGRMLIFLDSGVLVMDSCWEGYRLSEWRSEDFSRVAWTEDGASIEAEILDLQANRLTLRLSLRSGAEEQTFAPAAAPFTCPDMPH